MTTVLAKVFLWEPSVRTVIIKIAMPRKTNIPTITALLFGVALIINE
jgi:hypothetical protein